MFDFLNKGPYLAKGEKMIPDSEVKKGYEGFSYKESKRGVTVTRWERRKDGRMMNVMAGTFDSLELAKEHFAVVETDPPVDPETDPPVDPETDLQEK